VNKGRPVVAVVDDDPRLLESLENLLESEGYVARTFRSAESLLARGLTGVDVLVTDIGLPGMDGFDLRDRARRDRPLLPVFLITGRHEIADRSRAQGIDRFFRKPFDVKVLLEAVADALRNSTDGG
jgi:FixJ family two-component response regulator